ncbi:MAG: zinc ribbon domain-containing protein [Candidatus Heimdallarchaeaceae archaeon]
MQTNQPQQRITAIHIFKKHPLGIVAIIFWIIAGAIDVLDTIVVLATGDIIAGLMDILVVIALVCYLFTPTIATKVNANNPVPLAKTLFIVFASSTIVADVIYAAVALSGGYYLTAFYWTTLTCDILLTLFTVLGVLTTLKNITDFSSFSTIQRPVQVYQPATTQGTNIYAEHNAQNQVPSDTNVAEQNQQAKSFCIHCGAKLVGEKLFCVNCGEKQTT